MMDENYSSFKQLTDLALGMMLDYAKRERKAHEDAAQKCLDDQTAIQAEIDRRALAAYFDAHPELERLAINDEIAMPFDFMVKSVKAQIAKINLVDETIDIRYYVDDEHNPRYWVDMNMSRISDMRRAYLRDNPPTPPHTDG